MTARYKRVLILMADEHSNKVLGCHGHPSVRTPHLDRLAAGGTRFRSAYTNSPICVPARASLATGRYPFETGCWDNATPYTGAPPSWGHMLGRHGIPSYSIGKLHYRSANDDTGFTEQLLPMHIVDGVGDLLGSVRDPLPVRQKNRAIATEIGSGESAYTHYDRRITQAACDWIGRRGKDAPWVLFVSWVAPHYPLICPPEFYGLYDPKAIPLPKASRAEQWPDHPWLEASRRCFATDEYFTDETRRVALASYYGLVSFMDHNIGRVLQALALAGAESETLVVYTSDHGDNLGARGLWGKSNMYEESVGIPLIVRGAGVPDGELMETPASLVDIAPTLLDAFGCEAPPTRGRSLLEIMNASAEPDRPVFAEYHAAGAQSGAFMLRRGRYKFVHYVGMRPQLYDLERDPEELYDIAREPDQRDRLHTLLDELKTYCDPMEVDRRAKWDQQVLLARHGGRDAIVAKGGFGATPAPGEKPRYA